MEGAQQSGVVALPGRSTSQSLLSMAQQSVYERMYQTHALLEQGKSIGIFSDLIFIQIYTNIFNHIKYGYSNYYFHVHFFRMTFF
jgi:hypothetical protein